MPLPKSVKIELTGRCNLACKHCVVSVLKDRHDIDKEKYFKLIDELAKLKIKEVGMFYLGESFLVKWLPEAIKYAKDAGIPYVFLTTNGVAGSPDQYKAVFEAGLDSLKFSVNYTSQKDFKNITQRKPSKFLDLLSHIRVARRIRDEGNHKCGIFAGYINYTGERARLMKPVLEEITPFVDEIYSLPIYNHSELDDKPNWELSGGNVGRADNPRPPLPCWSAFNEAHVDQDMKLQLCCFFHNVAMADLNEVSFEDGWNSDEFMELRQRHIDEDIDGSVCEKCLKGE